MRAFYSLKLSLFVFFAILLSGCVAAVVAGAAAGMVYDKRGLMTLEADARLFNVIHKEIIKNPQFSHSRILVSSFNRVVLLVGQASSASLRVLAEKIAQRGPDVKRVYNEITVAYPLSMAQRTRDTFITSQVRSNLLAKAGLESGSIRVVTENATVYLVGIVTEQQAALAVDAARRVNGVNKVVKIFQYIR